MVNILSYDLTNAEGMTKALVDCTEWNPSRAAIMLKPFMPFLPEEILGSSFSETVFAMVHAFSAHSMETISAQTAMAMELVEMSKRMGASELTIILHQAAGSAISQHCAGALVNFLAVREEEVTLKIEY